MFNLNNDDMLRIVQRIIAGNCNRKTGTYNNQDPTRYEKIDCWVEFHYDPLGKKGNPATYAVRVLDVTWGTDITLTRENGRRFKFYVERDTITLRTRQGFDKKAGERVLRAMAMEGEYSRNKPIVCDGMDDYQHSATFYQ